MSFKADKVTLATGGKSFIFKNAACIVTMTNDSHDELEVTSPLRLGVLKNADLVIQDGKIVKIGQKSVLPNGDTDGFKNSEITEIDARHLTLMPGLIDAHTHSIYAGSRARETVWKSQGMTYEEIAKREGGILSTMRATREASVEELTQNFKNNALTALQRGVVLLESKTGYGLSPQHELKLLKCMYNAYDSDEYLPRLSPTLLGPHAASPDFQGMDNYIQALIEALPLFMEAHNATANKNIVRNLAADIFVERDYFTKEQGEKWLGAAIQHGLDVRIHADEFSRSGGCEVAIALAKKTEQNSHTRKLKGRVLSIDHGQYATESDLSRLHQLGVCAVALPATSFFSNIPFIDARKWRSSGVRVAIGSDFNPGSAPMNNLWFSAYLALSKCGFSIPEMYMGITKNAAYALGSEDEFGELALGKPAHLVAFEGTNPEDFLSSPLGDHIRYVITAPKNSFEKPSSS